MADDKHYVPGSFYRICDRTGFKVRAERTAKQWDNIIVRDQSWELRQPQDFVRGVYDDQNVSEPRPRQADVFLGPLTTLITATSATGTNVVTVTSNAGMSVSDRVSLILDNGNTFLTTINLLIGMTQVRLSANLPWSTSSGNEFVDLTAISQPDIG